MPDRWVGMVISGDRVVVVDAEVPNNGPIVIQSDHTWRLQTGDRPQAYDVIFQQCANYLRENNIAKVIVKASALTKGAAKLSHLHSAEVRGIVIAAGASVCDVKTLAKAAISRKFGKRKVDEYVGDDGYWDENIEGDALRTGSREAAMLILAARGSN
jgi:hypothetical protein